MLLRIVPGVDRLEVRVVSLNCDTSATIEAGRHCAVLDLERLEADVATAAVVIDWTGFTVDRVNLDREKARSGTVARLSRCPPYCGARWSCYRSSDSARATRVSDVTTSASIRRQASPQSASG